MLYQKAEKKYGWRGFGLELRKLLEPENYVYGGSSHLIFAAQLHKVDSGVQPFKTYAVTVRGKQYPVFEQRMLSGTPVGIPGLTSLGSRDEGIQSINEAATFGGTNPA